MGKPGKIVHSLKKPLGLQMKGSPYPMTASQENTFGPKGSNPNPGVYNGIKAADAKKSDSQGPEILGAIGGFLAKKALPFVAKTILGKGAGTLASKAVAGIGGALKEKMGEGEGGIGFGEKVKNYVGSLDLITKSNADGSLRKETTHLLRQIVIKI